MQGTCRL